MAFSSLSAKINNDLQSNDQISTWVAEYIFDYAASLKEREKKRHMFRKWSPQLEHRDSIVNFIKALADQLHYSHSTCHLALYIIDQFMDDSHIIAETHLKLFALVCIILAAKHEENDTLVPKLSVLRKYAGVDFDRQDYIDLEFRVMEHFDWELSMPTAVNFCEYHSLFAVFPADSVGLGYSTKNLRSILCALTYDYLEISLNEICFRHYSPSKIAAVCLRAARVVLKLEPKWPKVLEMSTGYSEEDLINCHRLLMRSIQLPDRKRKKNYGSPDTGYYTDSDASIVSPFAHKRQR